MATKSTSKSTPTPLSDYAENPPTMAEREAIGELQAQYFPKGPGKAKAPADETGAAALAALRQRVDTQEAAIARLQELAASAFQPCPCGRQLGNQPGLFLAGNVIYCNSGHHSWYSQRGAE